MVYLVLRSITYAQRGRDWLMQRGISSHVVRLPMSLGENGCGYALKIASKDCEQGLAWLCSGGINVLRAYEEADGGYKRLEI